MTEKKTAVVPVDVERPENRVFPGPEGETVLSPGLPGASERWTVLPYRLLRP